MVYRWDWKPGNANVFIYFGGLISELDDDKMAELFSAGPKTYGYKSVQGKTSMKAKDITKLLQFWSCQFKITDVASSWKHCMVLHVLGSSLWWIDGENKYKITSRNPRFFVWWRTIFPLAKQTYW